LKQNPEFKRCFQHVEMLCNTAKRTRARPFTPQDIIHLTDNRTSPLQRLCFQLWVTASRHMCSMKWKVLYHANHNCVELRFDGRLGRKGDRAGRRPFSKFVYCPHRSWTSLWIPTRISYRDLYRYVQSHGPPGSSCHSFRNGALKALQSKGFEAEEIAQLTGHKVLLPSVPGMRSYLKKGHPSNYQAQMSIKLSKVLLKMIHM
jgi:hypothetical protein